MRSVKPLWPASCRGPHRDCAPGLQALAGVTQGVDRPSRWFCPVATQGPDVDDLLALLAADPRLVVGVGGVGQVLVLVELIHAGGLPRPASRL